MPRFGATQECRLGANHVDGGVGWEPPIVHYDPAAALGPEDEIPWALDDGALDGDAEDLSDPDAFDAAAEIPPPQPFITWFLSGATRPHSDEWRGVALSPFPHQWHDQLRRLWADCVNPLLDFIHFVVTPSPPWNPQEMHIGHILITQSVPPELKAFLVSARLDDGPWIHRAFIGPTVITRFDLLFAGALHAPCIQHQVKYDCQVAFSGRTFEDDTEFLAEHGAGFLIRATTRNTLVHPGFPLHLGLDFGAAWPSDETFSGFETLHRIQQNLVQTAGDGVAMLHIPVRAWYLHHQGTTMRRSSRIALLGPHASTWAEDMVRVWLDQFRPEIAVHFHVVTPHPPDTGLRPDVPHILSQAEEPGLQRRAILTTAIIGWDRHHVALSAPSPTAVRPLIWMADLGHRCSPTGEGWDCYLWHAQTRVLPDDTISLQHGMSLVIERHWPRETRSSGTERPTLPEDEQDESALSLLQTSARCTSVTAQTVDLVSERLIAEPVAHTQQPETSVWPSTQAAAGLSFSCYEHWTP